MPDGTASRRRAVRGDHLRNHDRLLTAALEVFDEYGIDAPAPLIARQAGVGIATLYRHFPDRDRLVIELYDRASVDLTTGVVEVLRGARGRAPSSRVDAYLEALVGLLGSHRSYPFLVTRGLQLYPDRVMDPELVAELAELTREAHQQGVLASDVDAVDLTIMPATIAQLISYDAVGQDWVWKRALALVRRGLSPEAAGSVPMPPRPLLPGEYPD